MTERRPRLGFVGAGRVGQGLSLAFSRRGYEVSGVARRSGRPGGQEIVERSDIVFLTVPDDAIAGVAASLRWRSGVAAVHCSGAADLSALAPAAAAGAAVGGFHLLQMFADPEVAVGGLARCAIAIEAEEPLAGTLRGLVEALGARTLRVPSGTRAAYHAAAHYAGPFVAALLAEAVELWGRLGIDPEDGLKALLPLVRGSLDAIEHAGLAKAMAGSVARGDVRTIERHVQALGALDVAHRELYCRLALRTIPLALAAGRIDAAQAERLKIRLSEVR